MKPVVSIVIPAYNREAYVAEAIDSIFAQQDAPAAEVIVVDDGSTDGTAAVLARYGITIRVIHQANAGVSAARNTGIRAAAGEWIFLLDSDDRVQPGTLRTLLTEAERSPDATVVYADQAFLHEDGTIEPIERVTFPVGPAPVAEVFRRMPFSMGTALIRRDALIAAGLFDTSLHLAEDYELLCRMAPDNTFAYVPVVVLHYRRHGAQATEQLLRLIYWRYRVQQRIIRGWRRRGVRIDEAVRREAMDDLLIAAAKRHYWARSVPDVTPLLLAAARIRPRNWRLWLYWLLSHLPRWVFGVIDRRGHDAARE